MKFITKDNYKRYLVLDLFAIIILLFLLVGLYSFAYYNDTYSLRLVNAKVGNFKNITADYAIEYYIEKSDSNGLGTGKYKMVDTVPEYGYEYSNYTCVNGSNIEVNDKSVKLTSDVLDKCSIYFNVSHESADLNITYMLETGPNSSSYKQSSFMPIYGYTYSNYTCENNSVLNYKSETNTFNLEANSNDKCFIYYKMNKNNVKLNTFLVNNNTYEYVESLNTTKKYKLNSKSTCFNREGNIASKLGFNNNILTIDTTNNETICNVYFEEVTGE